MFAHAEYLNLTTTQRIENLMRVINTIKWNFLYRDFRDIYDATYPTQNFNNAYDRILNDAYKIATITWFDTFKEFYHANLLARINMVAKLYRPYSLAMYVNHLHELNELMLSAKNELEIAAQNYSTCDIDEINEQEESFLAARTKAQVTLNNLIEFIRTLTNIYKEAKNIPAYYFERQRKTEYEYSLREDRSVVKEVHYIEMRTPKEQVRIDFAPMPNNESSREIKAVVTKYICEEACINERTLYEDFCRYYQDFYDRIKQLKTQQLEKVQRAMQERDMEIARLSAHVNSNSALLGQKNERISFLETEYARARRVAGQTSGASQSRSEQVRQEASATENKFPSPRK